MTLFNHSAGGLLFLELSNIFFSFFLFFSHLTKRLSSTAGATLSWVDRRQEQPPQTAFYINPVNWALKLFQQGPFPSSDTEISLFSSDKSALAYIIHTQWPHMWQKSKMYYSMPPSIVCFQTWSNISIDIMIWSP